MKPSVSKVCVYIKGRQTTHVELAVKFAKCNILWGNTGKKVESL